MFTVGGRIQMFAFITKRTTPYHTSVFFCLFFHGLKRLYFRSFGIYTSPLGYTDSAAKEYNHQSRKPSASGTERTLYLVVDFIFLPGGMLANHLTITRFRSHCTTRTSLILVVTA